MPKLEIRSWFARLVVFRNFSVGSIRLSGSHTPCYRLLLLIRAMMVVWRRMSSAFELCAVSSTYSHERLARPLFTILALDV